MSGHIGAYNASYVYTHLGQLWQGPLAGGSTQYQYLYCGSSSTQPHALTGLYAIGATCSTMTGPVYTANTYDAFGNVTGRTFSSTTATLSYDLLDRLTKWLVSSTNKELYVYDASGNRVLRRTTTGSGTTMIVYAFGLEEHNYGGAGAHQSDTYYYSLGGRLLGALDSNGTTFYMTDALGSVLASFTNAAGGAALKANQVFGPYGSAQYAAGTLNTAKGFTQYNDGLTGLDYYNARYYDPVVGVFLSADRVQGNRQGLNPYAYVNGNPETHSDPTGRYMGTAIPLSQKGGAIAYTIPGTDLITTVINTGYIGSITTANGQVTSSSSGLTMNTFTRQQETLYGGYNPNTDAQNSPLAKLSQAIGLPQLQQTWSDPNATWLDKLMAIGNFAGTNLNNVLQFAMIVGGGPEGEAEAAAAEEESALAAGAERHIFEGELNSSGKATGYHWEGTPDTPGSTIPGTATVPDARGVYEAQVEVNGVPKSGFSSFFPQSMSKQEVLDSIDEAYNNRVLITGNTYLGETTSGMLVQMYLNGADEIISAFPLYEPGFP